MPKTYAGVLRRDRIEWTGESPQGLAADRPVEVRVTILSETESDQSAAERGRKMQEALEAIAREGGLPGAPDGAEWQRDVREDRSLPGRDA